MWRLTSSSPATARYESPGASERDEGSSSSLSRGYLQSLVRRHVLEDGVEPCFIRMEKLFSDNRHLPVALRLIDRFGA